MSFCLKIFKSHRSFDLPVVNSVQGIVKKRDDDLNFNVNGDALPDSKIIAPEIIESSRRPTPPKQKTNHNSLNTKTKSDNRSPINHDIKLKHNTNTKITQSLSDKVLRKKPKQCVKVDSQQKTLEAQLHDNITTPKHLANTISEHNQNTKHEKTVKCMAPKSPRPPRKQVSNNYEDIQSISDSTESINVSALHARATSKTITENTYITSAQTTIHKRSENKIFLDNIVHEPNNFANKSITSSVNNIDETVTRNIDEQPITKKLDLEPVTKTIDEKPITTNLDVEPITKNINEEAVTTNIHLAVTKQIDEEITNNGSTVVADKVEDTKQNVTENNTHSATVHYNAEIDSNKMNFNEIEDKTQTQNTKRKTADLPGDLNPPTQNNVRKEGVIADRIEQKSNKEIEIEFCEKDESSEELIRRAILANDFLSNMMDTESLTVVIKAMIPLDLEANSFIIKEGDVGAHFYVSAEGEFEVVKNGEVKTKFGSGVVFGELAILYQARRFASIKVTTNAKVWALERKMFRKIMMKTGSQEREQNIKFLSSVTDFNGLSVDVLHKIADLLKREFYPTGSTIIRQGDPGDKFYIIRGGKVTVIKKDSSGDTRVVASLKRGDYFGEQALINQDNRLASVIANEPGTECLTLDRNAFINYLGTIAELMVLPPDQMEPQSTKSNVINEDYDHILLEDLLTIGTLGVGGFGRVELVQYRNKETFALKILKKYDVACQAQIEHAYSEKETMAICDSPFIVKLYKTYRNNKYIYFLMEACLGGDVWSQLQRAKSFDDKTAKFVTGCVVEAFDYLHSRNIIYRDLKPENLMLDADGYVKLVDFGFAKRINPNNKTWTFAGTPEYVAPEIILNKGHDRSVDYWALGVFIHELLIGKPPFRGKDHMKTYSHILRGIDAIQMPLKISKPAQTLIKGLCRQNPTDRLGYQKKGIADIKRHIWFEGFEWDKLYDRTTPGPLMRPIKSNTDLSNFEEYPRDRDDPPDETSGWDINF